MAEINRIQRQRLLDLMGKEVDYNGLWLSAAEKKELLELARLAGIAPDAPLHLVRQWAAGLLSATPNTLQRSMSGKRALLDTLAMKYPPQPKSGRQAIVALWRERMDWDLTPKQRQLQRMRERWTTT